MAEKNVMAHENEEIIAKAQDFWTRYQKQITVVLAVLVLGIGCLLYTSDAADE